MTGCHQLPRHLEAATRRSKNATGTRSNSLRVEISQHIAYGRRGVVWNQPALTTSSGPGGKRLDNKFKYSTRELSALKTHTLSVFPETCKANDRLIHFTSPLLAAALVASLSCVAIFPRFSIAHTPHTHTTRSLVGRASSREITVMASDDWRTHRRTSLGGLKKNIFSFF